MFSIPGADPPRRAPSGHYQLYRIHVLVGKTVLARPTARNASSLSAVGKFFQVLFRLCAELVFDVVEHFIEVGNEGPG
jgi:hypothetical protein